MATCKSCGAKIVWATTASGKRIPIDAKPIAGAFVLTHHEPDQPPRAVSTDTHLSHFATCPDADEHRRKG